MTDKQISRALSKKANDRYRSKPDASRLIRKSRLKGRFKGRLAKEIANTEEKLQLLRELEWESNNAPTSLVA